jgi:non-homologous end joining protein Ku
MKIIHIVLLSLVLSGCAKYIVHPGAVNKLDSVTYDSLLTAKTIIDTSREEFAAGTLPVRLKPAVNELIAAYDKATPIYKDWHDAMAAGKATSDQLAALNASIDALNKAITAFKGAK